MTEAIDSVVKKKKPNKKTQITAEWRKMAETDISN